MLHSFIHSFGLRRPLSYMLPNRKPILQHNSWETYRKHCKALLTVPQPVLTFPSFAFPAPSDWVERRERVLAVRLSKMAERMIVSTDYKQVKSTACKQERKQNGCKSDCVHKDNSENQRLLDTENCLLSWSIHSTQLLNYVWHASPMPGQRDYDA